MNPSDLFAHRMENMQASEIRELLKVLDHDDIISFAGGIPDPSLFPITKFNKAFSDILSGASAQQSLQYSVSEGYLPLRHWLVGQMSKKGIDCDVDNILMTSGSQQALDYIGKMFLSKNDVAIVESPTYLGALQAFRPYEPKFEELRLDSCSDKQPKFIYTVPDFANPTGITLSEQERRKILTFADETNSLVIEDAPYKALRYSGVDQPSILALELEDGKSIDEARTIFCGSFSKTLSPGLRVGWVCASKQIIEKMVLIKQAADLHSPTINQMAIYEVVQGEFDDHVEGLKSAYRKKRDVMLEELYANMPAGVGWTKPDGGMFIWMELPKRIDAAGLLKVALRDHKIAFVPGQAFHANGLGANTLRLNFSHPSVENIRRGIIELGRCIVNFT